MNVFKYLELQKQLYECRRKEKELMYEMDSIWGDLTDEEIELTTMQGILENMRDLSPDERIRYVESLKKNRVKIKEKFLDKLVDYKYDDSVEKIFPLTPEDVNHII